MSSRLYGEIRTICGTEGLTQSRLEELIQRNEVEYSPYPEIDKSLKETAEKILKETKLSLELIVRCFRERGLEVDATI